MAAVASVSFPLRKCDTSFVRPAPVDGCSSSSSLPVVYGISSIHSGRKRSLTESKAGTSTSSTERALRLKGSGGFLQDFSPYKSQYFVGSSAGYRALTEFHKGNFPSNGSRTGAGALGAEMFLDRVFRIIRATVGSFISGQEDPEKILDQAVEEMGADLAKLRSTTAQVLASRRIIENKYNAAANASAEWYRRARKALEHGDEALAKEALKRRATFEDSAKKLKVQLDQQAAVSERILSSSRVLEAKIAEARDKKNLLKARAQSAKTAKWVGDMVGSIDTSSALAAYERMEEKVLALEAEANAVNEIATDSLETRFAILEAGAVDDDLATLKREMQGSNIPVPRELPPFETIERDWGSRRVQQRDSTSRQY